MSADSEANTATRKLWHIAGTGDFDQFEELLNEGAKVNAGDRTGVTALMRAAYHGQLKMVRVLIEHGADPNAKDRSGLTALTMARHGGHDEIVETLLSFGAQSKSKPAKPWPAGSATDERITSAITREAAPTATSSARTLHEPPDIWDLVHPTQAAPLSQSVEGWRRLRDSIVSQKLVSMKTLAFVATALIICGGIAFGFVALRGVWTADEESEQRSQSSIQPAAATKALSDRTRSTRAAKEPMKITPAGALWGETDDPLISRVTASARNSVKKSVARHTSAKPNLSRENKTVRKKNRPEGEQAANSKSAKKEQPPPAVDPVKPSLTQKPKVIQWP